MRACSVPFHVPPPRSIATMAADTTACCRYSALRMIALIGPPASGKGWGERAIPLISTLGSNRCNSMWLLHVSYGMGRRSGDDGWGYIEQSPSTACLAGLLVTPQ